MALFETLDDAPNYWPGPVYATSSTEGFPF